MRSRTVIAALAILLASGCTSDPQEQPSVAASTATPTSTSNAARTLSEPPADSAAAPAFELPLISGDSIDVTEIWTEKPVVLVFFEAWCELCKEQQATYNKLAADLGDQVQVLGIAGISKNEQTQGYVTEQSVDYPVGSDPTGAIWRNYGVAQGPLVAVVGRGGKLLAGFPGVDPDIISSVEGRLFQ